MEAVKKADLKAIDMPSKMEIVERMKKASVLGVTPQSDRFYNDYAGKLADSPKNAMGLVMAWELSVYDTLSGYPPQIAAVMSMNFDRVVQAIAPEIAKDAINIRNEILQEVKRS